MKYDLDYFIAKFEAIPEDQWITGRYEDSMGCKCAYGHCGATINNPDSAEIIALDEITKPKYAANINDNMHHEFDDYGNTPKERVVNYLKSLK